MQQDYTIAREKNAMFGSGILKVYFDAFSSKKRRGTTPANIYEQFCYADFIHFSFTGKEKDEETGYGYFGARYMDHELMTMWLSIDPMADKYPSISPYAYCAWNPVRVVDPNGMDTVISFNERKPNENNYRAYYKKNYKEKYDEAYKTYNRNIKLARNARRYKNKSDVIHVFAHGLEDKFGNYTGKMLWGNGEEVSPVKLYSILINGRSKDFYNNEMNEKGSVIMLHSCKAGQGFAQEFSVLLPNCLIIAPSDNRDILGGRLVDWEFVENGGDWLFYFNGNMVYKHLGDFFSTYVMEKKLEFLGTDGVLELMKENKLEELFK